MDPVQDHEVFGFAEFLKHPFDSRGSALNWFLFIGLLLAIIWGWNWILIRLANAVEEIA